MGILSSEVRNSIAEKKAQEEEKALQARMAREQALQAQAAQNRQNSTYGFDKGVGGWIQDIPARLKQHDIEQGWTPSSSQTQTQPQAPQSAAPESGQVMPPHQLASQFVAQAPFEEEQRQIAGGIMNDNQAMENDLQNILNEPTQEEEELVIKELQTNKPAASFAQTLSATEETPNQTDDVALQAAKDASLAMIRRRNDENVSKESLAEEYTRSIKENPWYQDDKVWGAALGFGIALLGGADADEAALFGAMVSGNVKQQEVAERDRLRAIDETQRLEFNEREQSLENAEIERLAALADRDVDRESVLDAARIKAGATMRTGANAANKEAQKAYIDMAERDNKLIEEVQNKSATARKTIEDLGLSTGMGTQVDDDGYVRFASKMDPSLTGFFEQPFNVLGEMFGSEAGSNRAQVKTGMKTWLQGMIADMPGVASDTDVKNLEATFPALGASDETWQKWMDNFDRVTLKIQQKAREKGKRLREHGQLMAQRGGLEPDFIYSEPFRQTQPSNNTGSKINTSAADAIVGGM